MNSGRETMDLTNQRFGNFVVIKKSESNKHGKVTWVCMCDCGNERIITTGHLRSGNSFRCDECGRKSTIDKKTTHAASGSAEYGTWGNIKDRCSNPKNHKYHRYGGRGIEVCAEWKTSFETFLKDMGPKPSLEHSIDRRDNDGNYEPSNCRWATSKEQSRNRRNNHLVEFKGSKITIAELVEISGLPQHVIQRRVTKLKLSGDIAVLGPTYKVYTINGMSKTASGWATYYGLTHSVVNGKIRNGATIYEALGLSVTQIT